MHSHSHNHKDHHHSIELSEEELKSNSESRKRIIYVLLLTFSFMIAEVVGGIMSNSLALLSDAAHMMGDSTALLISLGSLYLAKIPPSSKNTFGYQKVESLAGLANSVLLIVMAGNIVYHAFERLSAPPDIKGEMLLIVAVLGLLVNIGAAFILSSQKQGLALKAAFLHVLGDAISSVGAIIAGLLVIYKSLYIADVVISFIVAGIILYSSLGLLKVSVSMILQAVPDEVDVNSIEQDLLNIESVEQVHDLHIWKLSQNKIILTVHLVSQIDHRDSLMLEAKNMLKEKYPISHSTIQVEPPGWSDSD